MKSSLIRAGYALALAGFGVSLAHSATTSSIDGRWDAALVRPNGDTIPFRLDISGDGANTKGTLYNGFQAFDGSTSGSFANGELTLNIDHYLTSIHATLKNDALVGDVKTQNRASTGSYGFKAVRHVDVAPVAGVPQVAGSYIIPLATPSAKGEKAFHLIVAQQNDELSATILRVDGDTGAYTGKFKDGKWRLSHFDGSRPGIIEITPKADGTLAVEQNPSSKPAAAAAAQVASTKSGSGYGEEAPIDSRYTPELVAYKSDVALAKGLPQPENYETHTTARDANEKFTFNFPDVNGKLVSQDDPRFKGKVVLAIVTGTWCPNCHDEAQYLVQLDKKYRDKGLAIVALDFEEPEQQGSFEREKAFVKQYGVDYTYLIAGAPAEMWEKVPQLVNLNTWPATVFVGRDGLVKSTHSGFASPASGKFNDQLKAEFTAKIERLLAENASSTQSASTGTAPPISGGE